MELANFVERCSNLELFLLIICGQRMEWSTSVHSVDTKAYSEKKLQVHLHLFYKHVMGNTLPGGRSLVNCDYKSDIACYFLKILFALQKCMSAQCGGAWRAVRSRWRRWRTLVSS